MSAEPAPTTRDRLHALIDTLDDEVVEDLLFHAQNQYAPRTPLTEQQVAEINRRLANYRPGTGIPHEEVKRRFGTTD